jgi:hypothetical protein
VLIGRDGTILHQMFGVEDDIAVGARIAMALAASVSVPSGQTSDGGDACIDGRCATPVPS